MDDGSGSPAVRRFEFWTRDEAETEEFIQRMYIGNRSRFLSAADDSSFTAQLATAGPITAGNLRSTVNFRAMTDPFDHFLFLSVTNGYLRVRNGRDEIALRAGDQSFYQLGLPLEVELHDMGVRTLQLPTARLGSVAEQAAGIPAEDLRFESTTPVSALMARQWADLTKLIWTTLFDEGSGPAPLLAEELTRTAAVTALHTFPNTALNIEHRPDPGWVSPAVVRRAAAFIRSHADQPITLDQIAAAAGVGGRPLRYAFRRQFGVTPIGYLKWSRLERARQELEAPEGMTVAEVARRWGWSSTGRFTASYRRRFGPPPSHALRR